MVFSSAIFLFAFLPIVFILNCFIKDKYSNVLLLIASLLFYAWGEPTKVFLMMFSIIINWLIGKAISKSDGIKRKIVLVVGIAVDIVILGYYKYAAFLTTLLNGILHKEILVAPDIDLPIGISFFTFQAMSYIVDIYKNRDSYSQKFINTALYISFFPQLIAGPIVKYKDINEQIENRTVTLDKTSTGFRRFIYGLSKKVLISNVLGTCVDVIFAYDLSQIDTRMAWIGAVSYSLQIYYDFSGYSDMAIGLGKMFGFDIMENFNYPYLSKSISEFWRRWHISLGGWFREYVYIPLGGNRKGKMRTYLNLFIVFALTGLWHGADLSFVVWGIYYVFFVIIERMGLSKLLERNKIVSVVYCTLIVIVGWVIFRADSIGYALGYILKMMTPWRSKQTITSIWYYMDKQTIFTIACALLGMGILKISVSDKIKGRWINSSIEAVYCIVILVLSIVSIASGTYNPFIYFQF
jgi:alginate O-acetyltransferase complex protein AlgI